MIRPLSKSLSLMFFVSITFCVLLSVNNVMGKEFTPPVPDKTKTLPTNDGGPDGCDSSRFKCVMNGAAVLDKQTGLIWAKDYAIFQKVFPWGEAVNSCQNIEIGGQKGWRLPTRDELITLLDTSQALPALPEGHPFTKMNNMENQPQSGDGTSIHWTSTEYNGKSDSTWVINLGAGTVLDSLNFFDYRVWPVRDGK